MFKKILNKKKEEADSSDESEDETVPHVGKKEKRNSIANLKEKLGGGPSKKESKSSVRGNSFIGAHRAPMAHSPPHTRKPRFTHERDRKIKALISRLLPCPILL
jgi:hypothetical protein